MIQLVFIQKYFKLWVLFFVVKTMGVSYIQTHSPKSPHPTSQAACLF